MILKFGFWNQLADGLGLGEFLTQEYPNWNSPSDHPPVAVSIEFY